MAANNRIDALRRSIVLVVDDHPDTLQLLTDALDNAGVTVLVATSGQQALDQVAHLLPDLILLDAVMPGMDGFETCRRLKAGVAAGVPVIFMTGLEDTEHIVQGLDAGGIDYLTKPIAPDELLARMRVHLARARETQEAQAALDVSGRTMLAVDAGGHIKWATPQAQQILLQLCERGLTPATQGDGETPRAIALPVPVQNWLRRNAEDSVTAANDSVIAGSADLKIRFRLLSRVSEDETLLVIQPAAPEAGERSGIEKLQKHFVLTSREAEVLYWLSRGKSNRDIAEILRISTRTAHKHLEHVYSKIGVESRSGAAALSVRVLDQ